MLIVLFAKCLIYMQLCEHREIVLERKMHAHSEFALQKRNTNLSNTHSFANMYSCFAMRSRAEIAATFEDSRKRKQNAIVDAAIRKVLEKSSTTDTKKVADSVTWAKFGPKSLAEFAWNLILEEVSLVAPSANEFEHHATWCVCWNSGFTVVSYFQALVLLVFILYTLPPYQICNQLSKCWSVVR